MGKAGRPFLDDPRKDKLIIRLNSKESDMLNQLCKQTGMSKSDAIRHVVEKTVRENMKEE